MTDNLIMFPVKSEPALTGYFKCAECKNDTFMLCEYTPATYLSLRCSGCGITLGWVDVSAFKRET
jgi:ribosomal protein S27E